MEKSLSDSNASKIEELRQRKAAKVAEDVNKQNILSACNITLDFFEGKISKEDFISNYNKFAHNAYYAHTILDLMRSGLSARYDVETWCKFTGMSKDKCLELFEEQGKFEATKKIVNALFEVAYTRTPNNELGGDGKPMSYRKTANSGYAAEAALFALSTIIPGYTSYTPEIEYLRSEFAFPRAAADFKVADSKIIETVKEDYKNRRNTREMAEKQKSAIHNL